MLPHHGAHWKACVFFSIFSSNLDNIYSKSSIFSPIRPLISCTFWPLYLLYENLGKVHSLDIMHRHAFRYATFYHSMSLNRSIFLFLLATHKSSLKWNIYIYKSQKLLTVLKQLAYKIKIKMTAGCHHKYSILPNGTAEVHKLL